LIRRACPFCLGPVAFEVRGKAKADSPVCATCGPLASHVVVQDHPQVGALIVAEARAASRAARFYDCPPIRAEAWLAITSNGGGPVRRSGSPEALAFDSEARSEEVADARSRSEARRLRGIAARDKARQEHEARREDRAERERLHAKRRARVAAEREARKERGLSALRTSAAPVVLAGSR
jgi:hypothetical protein